MALPLPTGKAWTWSVRNEFHLLSDEDAIAPYFRPKHRASVVPHGSTLTCSNVAQLRYVRLTNNPAGFSRPLEISKDGWDIIKEEKAGVLAAGGAVSVAHDDG